MQNSQAWGKSVAINLKGCGLGEIADPEKIKTFISEVIVLIGMKAHGPVHIERFGYDELEGYSAMQFIETSSITIHCDEFGKRCFIDIFSCKDFDHQLAERFAKEFFKAAESTAVVLER